MTYQSTLEEIRNTPSEKRVDYLNTLYEKNIRYFKERHPSLISVLETVKCPYSLTITEEFVDVVDDTGTPVLASGKLDVFAEMLGDWVHNTWVDLFNFKVVTPKQYPLHFHPVKNFYRSLMCRFPEYPIRFAQGKINLKEIEEARKFSPPTIFLGIFHGLQIDQYLAHSDVHSVLLVEPDEDKFEVSCHFLDYERIANECGTFFMAVGPDVEALPIRTFFSSYHVSRQMWTRVLPGYESEKMPLFIESFKMLQTSYASIIFPIDHDIAGLQHAVENIENKIPVLSSDAKLSRKSKIAIVASGPSLDADLPWLKKNENRLIIIAVQSVVKVLVQYGITIDFQVSLETLLNEDVFESLELLRKTPALLFYKAHPQLVDYFNHPLLCPTGEKASPVVWKKPLESIAPSTTNLALSFALHVRPKELYLLGCDFGYIDLNVHHASGGSSAKSKEGDQEESLSHFKQMSQAIVAANFPETQFVQTTPFLSHTRISVEGAVEKNGTAVHCVNLSNGAKVRNIEGKRSKDVRLGSYPKKEKDIQKILDLFQSPRKNKNWLPYTSSAEEVLSSFKKRLIENLQLDEFTWLDFNRIIDTSLDDALTKSTEGPTDRRLDIYVRFVVDLLSSWYCSVIFFDDVKMAEEVYKFGLAELREIIDGLTWPVKEFQ